MPAGKKAKVIVFGMDGATFRVADLLMATGNMPALKSIIARGCRAPLESTTPWHSGPAWTSCTTGVLPAKHGIFNFLRMNGAFGQKPVVYRDVAVERVWSILNRQGYSTGVFNVPLTWPVAPVNGFMVSGTPASFRDMYPRELLHEFAGTAAPILDPTLKIDADSMIIPELAFKKRMDDDNVRLKILSRILERDVPDFLMAVFTSTDELQHCFWHFFDETHPMYNKDNHLNMDKVIPLAYMNMDKTLAAVIDLAAGPDTTVIVVSDHGFGPAGKILYPNILLCEWGLLTRSGLTAGSRSAPMNVPSTLGFDPDKSSAFMTPSIYGFFADIILCHNGSRARESLPEAGYSSLRNSVSKQFENYIDPGSGLPPVERIFYPEELFAGPSLNLAGDMLLYCPGYNCLPSLKAEFPVCINKPWCYDTMAQTGTHERYGIFAAAGPAINSADLSASSPHIADISAIVLSLFDISVPGYFDGRVPAGLFKDVFEHSIQEKSVINVSPETENDTVSGKGDISEMDEELIKKNLKGLGYLE